MAKFFLLLICFIVFQEAFCWNAKHISTDLYEEMSRTGKLKNLKNITYSATLNWKESHEGIK